MTNTELLSSHIIRYNVRAREHSFTKGNDELIRYFPFGTFVKASNKVSTHNVFHHIKCKLFTFIFTVLLG